MSLSPIEIQLRGYEPVIERLALRRAARHPNELDDLMQEARILVWRKLAAGIAPTDEQIDNRMRSWIKLRSRQLREMPTDYDKLLPIKELREVNAAKVSTRELPGASPDEAE